MRNIYPLPRRLFESLPDIAAWIAYLFLVGPLLVIVVASFGSSTEIELPPKNLSFGLYLKFFTDRTWWEPALASLGVAAVTTAISIVITVPAAYALSRTNLKGTKGLELLLISPMLVPVITLGLGLYMFLSKFQLDNTYVGVILAHCTLAVPFMFISVSAGFRHTDPALESVAMLMGASRLRTFFRVLLPQLRASIGVGALFSFLVSFDEVVVAYFITGPQTVTLPVKMYSAIRWEVSPVLTAISSLLTVLSLVACLGIAVLKRDTSSSRS